MKVYTRWLLLIVVFAVLSPLLLFYLANRIQNKQVERIQPQSTTSHPEPKKQVLAVEVQKETPGLPVRLKIPRINVDAAIQYVGLTSDGYMAVPSNSVDVGWYDIGPRPGEKGSAVIAGHLNNGNGAGVFTNLYKLKQGDNLYIEDSSGASTAFVVRESRDYDPGHADEVFSRSDSAHLNLITCNGVWNRTQKSYNKRLVVFTDIKH